MSPDISASSFFPVIERLAEGWGLERVAAYARAKAPPKRLGDGDTRRMTWGQSTIRSIYASETIRAIVVDPDLAARADAARRSNYRFRPTGEWEWPLRGAVRCACGHLLMGHATGRNPHRIRYYRCRSHPYAARGTGNRRPGHRADLLEAAFIEILKGLKADPDRILRRPGRSIAALKARESALRGQIAKLDRRRRRACELAEEGAYSGVDLRERLSRIDAERRAANAELDDARNAIRNDANETLNERRLAEVVATLPGLWSTLPIADRQRIARAISNALGGLYATPERPGRLVASLRKVKTTRKDVSRETYLALRAFLR
jgi:hypothetical protein